MLPNDTLRTVLLTTLTRFPKGVINTVPSLGPVRRVNPISTWLLTALLQVGGAALAAHPDVDKVAFTGSTVTGRKIMEAAAKSNIKKVRILS